MTADGNKCRYIGTRRRTRGGGRRKICRSSKSLLDPLSRRYKFFLDEGNVPGTWVRPSRNTFPVESLESARPAPDLLESEAGGQAQAPSQGWDLLGARCAERLSRRSSDEGGEGWRELSVVMQPHPPHLPPRPSHAIPSPSPSSPSPIPGTAEAIEGGWWKLGNCARCTQWRLRGRGRSMSFFL